MEILQNTRQPLYGVAALLPCVLRYSEGVMPYTFLKVRIKSRRFRSQPACELAQDSDIASAGSKLW